MTIFPRSVIVVFLLVTTAAVFGTGQGPPTVSNVAPFQITGPLASVSWYPGETVNITWSVPTGGVPADFTAPDGYGCNIALFLASDHTVLQSYISQQAVFSLGLFQWNVSTTLPLGTSYSVGVGFSTYVVGAATILITSPLNATTTNATSSILNATSATNSTGPRTTSSANSTKSAVPQMQTTTANSSQEQSMAATPGQFQSVGGVGGLVGIVVGAFVVVGGILGVMGYNAYRERTGRPPGLGSGVIAGSQYGGGGSSYVPKSGDSYSYGGEHSDTGKAQISSAGPDLNPLNSPPLAATTALSTAGSRSTYTPFSKRNPNPHHDNVDLLHVDPFVKPVPAYVLQPDLTDPPTGDSQQRTKGEEPGASPYNYI